MGELVLMSEEDSIGKSTAFKGGLLGEFFGDNLTSRGISTAGDGEVVGCTFEDDSASLTPEVPSTIPIFAAARTKYCMVVPVLRVLIALSSSSRLFNDFGTKRQCAKWSNFISMTVL
jgi:hypothetical protein